jgi:hypothetical protein
MVRCSALIVVFCVAACGNISRKQDDAGVLDDGRVTDAPDASLLDAGVDAMMVIPPTEARELVPGGVRMQGTTYRFDVQFGHGLQQHKATGTTYSIEGNTGIKP